MLLQEASVPLAVVFLFYTLFSYLRFLFACSTGQDGKNLEEPDVSL